MADVTFGVKVTEEMKNELGEIMKSTQLSGKEFMGLLLSAYRLEKNNQEESVLGSDISELQKLLGRVQNLYLNINERAGLYVEERLKEKDAEAKQVVIEHNVVLEKLEAKESEIKGLKEEIVAYKNLLKEAKGNEENLGIKLQEQASQLKNNQLLYEKYEKEVINLKQEIENYKRLDIEIEERSEENTKLQKRNDELASEVWFLKSKIEKITEESKNILEKHAEKEIQLKNQYSLELKNALLEQKLSFGAKIELLKEEQYKMQQEHSKAMNTYLEKKLAEESK